MKVLFFVDTHGDEECMTEIILKSRLADLLVCLGDFTIFETDITKILSKLNSIGKKVLILHGNHETASAVLMESSNFDNLHFIHKRSHIHEDVIFFGYGGGGFSIHDPAFDNTANAFIKDFENIKTKSKTDYKLILLTHGPPYGTHLDDLGSHVGCKNFTEFIKKYQPLLAVSGHLHDNFGAEDIIGKTRLINPGPKGKIIEL